jgi:hypothetical protein
MNMAIDSALQKERELDWELTQIFYECMEKYPDGFDSDTIWNAVRANGNRVPPTWVSKKIGAFFRSFYASGILIKLQEHRISKRAGGSCIPVYRKAGTSADVRKTV